MNLMLPPDSFQGKTILITGGGSGLGLSMAEGLLRLGAQVALLSRNEEKLQKAADKLMSETGGNVITFSADVRDAANGAHGQQSR
jgi:NAD(P)-dependent dehydrogenase (short-subunit alcohol dehydrogenase family)